MVEGRVVELPIKDETKKVKNRKARETKTDDENTDFINMEKIYQLQSLYLEIYQKLSVISPEIAGLPEYKETYPVDKKKYDKCVDRVHRILLTIYAIGLIGEYKDTYDSKDLVSDYNDITKLVLIRRQERLLYG